MLHDLSKLKDAGIPPGPLAEQLPVYSSGGRATKTHLVYGCRDATAPLTTTYWNLDEFSLCATCASRFSVPREVRAYAAVATELAELVTHYRELAAPEGAARWVAKSWFDPAPVWLTAHGAPDRARRLRENHPGLAEWADTEFVPAAQAARESLAAYVPQFAGPDWATRHVAADLWSTRARDRAFAETRADHHLLCTTPAHGKHLCSGQGGVIDVVRNEAVKAFRETPAGTTARADAAVSAAAAELETPTLFTQLPEPGTLSSNEAYAFTTQPTLAGIAELWRSEASAALIRLGNDILVDLARLASEIDSAPSYAYLAREEWARHRNMGMRHAVVREYTRARVDDEHLLLFAPVEVADYLKGVIGLDLRSLGPVLPEDTVEVFLTAIEMRDTIDEDLPDVVRVVRATAA